MSRTVYVNGDYLPEGEAKVSIFDRGFLMAPFINYSRSTRMIDPSGRTCDRACRRFFRACRSLWGMGQHQDRRTPCRRHPRCGTG